MSFRSRLRSSGIGRSAAMSQPAAEESDSSEVEDLNKLEAERQRRRVEKVQNKLKKMGITDVEMQDIQNFYSDDATSARKTRSSINKSSSPVNLIENNLPTKKLTNEPEMNGKNTKTRQITTPKSTRKNTKRKELPNLNTDSALSTLLMAAKKTNRRRNGDTESEDEHQLKKKVGVNDKASLKCNSNDNETSNGHCESEPDDSQLLDDCCKVPGCDSKGHLSGAYPSHNSVDTCPTFHNQNSEDCIARHQKRLELANKALKQSPTKLRKSPIKRPIKRSLDNDSNWTSVMNQRKAEMHDISQSQTGEAMSTITSSRQPNLIGFTPKFDLDLFLDAQSRTAQLIHLNSALERKPEENETPATATTSTSNRQTGVQSVVLGRHEIDVWYSSPYSDDFQNCLKLYICEFCLKCMNSSLILQRHANKCTLRHPPGNEIYRKGNISFFEIDGNNQKEYCQNLCLLAKLFLDYKTLFFDVEPFLFYIMTEWDEAGMHIVGYFSKEKHSATNNNVSCILTLPHYQRHGYGRMLIDFSYLLTKTEGKVGSPEKPISDLGLISYRSYWKFAVMDFLSKYDGKDILLKDMSQQTGINSNDIVSTLQLMGLLKYWKGNHLILVPPELKSQFAVEVKKKKKQYADKVIDPKCLSWTPKIWPQTK